MFEATFGLLVTSVVLAMKHAAPVMKRQQSGSIVNNASLAGMRAGYAAPTYSAAKAAVIQITRSVAMELGESKVRVNSISPGFMATGIVGRLMGLPPADADATAAALIPLYESMQPLPRAGTADDVARAALWLASDDASFVNGENAVVDGGAIQRRRWSEQQAFNAQVRAAVARAAEGKA